MNDTYYYYYSPSVDPWGGKLVKSPSRDIRFFSMVVHPKQRTGELLKLEDTRIRVYWSYQFNDGNRKGKLLVLVS